MKIYGEKYIEDVATRRHIRPDGRDEPPPVNGPEDYGANGGADQQRANGGEHARDERTKSRLSATPYQWRDPTTIKPRDFLYGNHIVRGYVTGLVSMGDVGKTSEIQVEIAAMVTGHDLLDTKPKRTYRVWYINLEDPQDEIDRRFA